MLFTFDQSVSCPRISLYILFYLADKDTPSYYIFITRVLLGETCPVDGQNTGLKKAPCKVCHAETDTIEFACKKHAEFFDSVMGKLPRRQYREFIVYDKAQCYPEFLVELRNDEDLTESESSLED